MVERDTYFVCACGADIDDADEQTICPSCRRWGCWTEHYCDTDQEVS
jgi:hypothetical protein